MRPVSRGESPLAFTSGTSEILNWITDASALREHLFDYIPAAYRSLAGTGAVRLRCVGPQALNRASGPRCRKSVMSVLE